MQERRTDSDVPAVAENVKDFTDSVNRLVREHVELAKAEVQDRFKKLGRDVVLCIAALFLFTVGYGLLVFGLTVGLGQVLGLVPAFLIVAGLHLVVGGVLFVVYGRRLAGPDKPSLEMTTKELQRDKRFVNRLGQQLRESES